MQPDDLYALPLKEFTAARNALATELRDPDVKKLKKPTRVAWVLNQLVRDHPDAAEELLEAGDRLRDAQKEALRGSGASGLRGAGDQLNQAVETLVELAAGALRGEQLDQARATLRAAATDAEVADQLARGVLVEAVQAAGFGLDDLPFGMYQPSAKSEPRRLGALDRRRLRKLEERVERTTAQAERLTKLADEAETRAREARNAADRAANDQAAAYAELEALRRRDRG